MALHWPFQTNLKFFCTSLNWHWLILDLNTLSRETPFIIVKGNYKLLRNVIAWRNLYLYRDHKQSVTCSILHVFQLVTYKWYNVATSEHKFELWSSVDLQHVLHAGWNVALTTRGIYWHHFFVRIETVVTVDLTLTLDHFYSSWVWISKL